jgi:hypothetical protein
VLQTEEREAEAVSKAEKIEQNYETEKLMFATNQGDGRLVVDVEHLPRLSVYYAAPPIQSSIMHNDSRLLGFLLDDSDVSNSAGVGNKSSTFSYRHPETTTLGKFGLATPAPGRFVSKSGLSVRL